MFEHAYTRGCWEALMKLGATQLFPELTAAQKAQMQGLTGFGGRSAATPEQRGLQRFLGSPLETGPGPTALQARSQQMGHAMTQRPGLPPLPRWTHPQTGAHGYGGQNLPMTTEDTVRATSPSKPVSPTGHTQHIRPQDMEAMIRAEQGTKVIPHATMAQEVFGKKPATRAASDVIKNLFKLRRLVHV